MDLKLFSFSAYMCFPFFLQCCALLLKWEGAIKLIFASQKEIRKVPTFKAVFQHFVLPDGYEASSDSTVQLA